jgi:hypothetical protein
VPRNGFFINPCFLKGAKVFIIRYTTGSGYRRAALAETWLLMSERKMVDREIHRVWRLNMPTIGLQTSKQPVQKIAANSRFN